MSQDCRQDNFEGNPTLGLQGHHNPGMQEQQNSSSLDNDGQQWANYPKIGHEHPDGPNVRRVHENHKDNLNFGWFSLPRSTDGTGGTSGEKTEICRPDSKAGATVRNNDGPQYEQIPPSRSGHRQFQPSRQSGQMPPSRMSQRLDSQQNSGEPDRLVMDQSETNSQQQDIDVGYGNQPPMPDDNVVFDWPLSRVAQEYAMRCQPKSASPKLREKASSGRNAPPSRAGCREVPPTPMPPLSWGGYGNATRPTFESWREDWHRKNNRDHEAKYKDFNCNNNNDVTNNNNNDDDHNGSAIGIMVDVNNNNNHRRFWSTKSRSRVHAQSDQYSSSLPKFYCPNVVMKWEDTDDQGQTLPSKQRTKYKSFRDRVRGSFDSFLSVFCMKKLKTSIGDKMKMGKYKKFDESGKKDEGPDQNLY